MKRPPRINSALSIGVDVGADAHRVASYNPWVALRCMVDGKTVGGAALRGPEETPTRENVLRTYTQGSAWSRSRKKRARLAGNGEARGPGAVEGLLQGAGGGD